MIMKKLFRTSIAALTAALLTMTMISCGPDALDTPGGGSGQTGPATVAVTGVSLNKTSLNLVEGSSETLTATVAPSNATNKTVSWKSSDVSTASVDDSGKVTAVKAGSATITVTTADGSKTATCSVTITSKTISVTGVSVDKTSLEITEGETAVIKATVSPDNATDKSVKWSSSDEAIATVSSDGTITALKPGKVTITVTTTDGSKTASCEVTVKAKYVPVTGLKMDSWALVLVVGEKASLEYTVLPDDATNKEVTFSSSDTKVATVDSKGVVQAVSPGSAVMTIKTAEGDFTATCTVTVMDVGGTFEAGGIYFKNFEGKQLEVVANPVSPYSGNITVPATVSYNDIEYTVFRIAALAFSNCENLVSVTLENGIKEISWGTFTYCPNLETVKIPASVNHISEDMDFAYSPKLELIVAPDNRWFFVEDGALYYNTTSNNSTRKLYLKWVQEKKTGTLKINEETVRIAQYSLVNTNIDKLEIPASVTEIATRFFDRNCKTPLEIVLNWTTKEDIDRISTREKEPFKFYFNKTDMTKVTVSVPAGTKPFYQAHWLWGACGNIVER